MRVWSVGVTLALAAVLTTKFGVVAAAAQVDRAQAFPNRAIKIIVPFPAGGPTDINIRIIAQHMSEDWKNPVVIENRPGASTAIGAQAVARAEPDGYTLLAAMNSTLVINPAAAAPLSYDPFNDFAAITMTAKNTSLLTVRASDGPHSVKELIARGKLGRLTYGAGIVITRLAGYLLGRLAGIDLQYIPYKGSSEVVQGLLSGSIDFIIDGAAPSLPLIRSGQFRALAKLNSRPLSQLPDLPPLAVAAGLPGTRRYVELDRTRRAGRDAEAGDRQNSPGGGRHLRGSGGGRSPRKSRHQPGDLDTGGIRHLLPQRSAALGQGLPRQWHQARLNAPWPGRADCRPTEYHELVPGCSRSAAPLLRPLVGAAPARGR